MMVVARERRNQIRWRGVGVMWWIRSWTTRTAEMIVEVRRRRRFGSRIRHILLYRRRLLFLLVETSERMDGAMGEPARPDSLSWS